MLEEIGRGVEKIAEFIKQVKDKNSGVKLMGFGHRVYKNYDPRAKLMRETCHEVLDELGLQNDPLFKLAMALEKIALEDEYFVSRKLYPNVDFYSGIVQRALGIPVVAVHRIFAMARTVGWIAQLERDDRRSGTQDRPSAPAVHRLDPARRQADRPALITPSGKPVIALGDDRLFRLGENRVFTIASGDGPAVKPSERNFARRIDLTSLQLFVAVCELGSIGKAAEREFIAASAVSKRLSDLEATLETPLLYRHTRGVDLTPAGESLLHHARSVLFSLEKMQGELSEYADGVRGHVRIHASISAIVQFLPEDLGAFVREHRQVKIDLEEHLSTEIVRAVQEGAADLGICNADVLASGHELQTLPYRRGPLGADRSAPPSAGPQEGGRLRETLECDHVGLHTNSSIYLAMREAAAAAGRTIKLRIHVTGLDAMCRMIHNGLGVGVMPRRAFELMQGVGELECVALTDPWARRQHRAGGPRFLDPAGDRPAAGRPPHGAAGSRTRGGRRIKSTQTGTPMGRTLYDKIWDEHVVHTEEDGTAILYIDRHLVHEVTSPQAFEGLREAGRKVWRVSSIVATADHNTPTTGWERGYDGITDPISKEQVTTLDKNIGEFGAAAYFPFLSKRQGIVHVIGPEQGATLPGMTVVCGDSQHPPTARSARWRMASAPARWNTCSRHRPFWPRRPGTCW